MVRAPSSVALLALAALTACSAENCEEEPACIPVTGEGTASTGGNQPVGGGGLGGMPGGGGAGAEAGGGSGAAGGTGGQGGQGGQGGVGGAGGGAGGTGGTGAAGGAGGVMNLLQLGGMGGTHMGAGGGTAGIGGATTGGSTSLPAARPCARGVSAASVHSCVARGDGSIWCWGGGQEGQLGQGTTASSSIPVRVSSIVDAVAWDSFGMHNCAILGREGRVWCWGDNSAQQLGDPSLPDSAIPIQRTNLERVRDIAVGIEGGCSTGSCGYTCAALSGGRVRCWGSGERGTLGTGMNTTTNVPLEVIGATLAVDVDAGYRHACSRTGAGSLRCWGGNDFAQLGNGLTIEQNISVPVTVVEKVKAVAVGGRHSCAILQSGRAACWGANEIGQLGNGDMELYSPDAQQVQGLLGVAEIAAGANHTCARLTNGTVWCWGANDRGQTGDGTMGEDQWSNFPIQVLYIDSAEALSLGATHACVLQADDSVWCWGANDEGQLGDGTTVDRPFPVQVQGLFEEAE